MMSSWFYHNKKGDKVGPIPVATIRLLAQQGVIGPDTVVENQNGRSSPAGQIRGLFLESESAVSLEKIPVEVPVTNHVVAEEPISNGVYGLVSQESPPQPPLVEPRPVAAVPAAPDPFTMPVDDNPFSLNLPVEADVPVKIGQKIAEVPEKRGYRAQKVRPILFFTEGLTTIEYCDKFAPILAKSTFSTQRAAHVRRPNYHQKA